MTRRNGGAVLVILLSVTCALALAQDSPVGYTDTPMLPDLPYRVHDPSRPHPPVVTPAAQPGGPPSDAIVLFDGKDLSQWTPARQPWKVENGYMEELKLETARAANELQRLRLNHDAREMILPNGMSSFFQVMVLKKSS